MARITAKLIEPLVSADADLTSLPAMLTPVSFALDPNVPPDALNASVRVKLLSIHQKPAGSLPGKDKALARLLGYGEDVAKFKDLKRLGCMNGWLKATDGRLYHPDVAEIAHKALETRRKNFARTAPARAAREALRPSSRSDDPEEDCSETGIEENFFATSSMNLRQPVENIKFTTSVTDDVSDVKLSRSISTSNSQPASFESVPRARAGEAQPAQAPTLDQPDNKPLERSRYPRRSDPPEKWLGFLTTEHSLDEEGVSHPRVSGFHLDEVCQAVCTAAGIVDPHWRGDWETVARWLNDGIRSSYMIDAIKERVERKGFTPKGSLKWFDGPVRDFFRANPNYGGTRRLTDWECEQLGVL